MKDPKKIELNDDDRELLQRAENSSGKPWRTLLRELVAPILRQPPSNIAEKQWQRRKELIKEISALNEIPPNDGILAGRDHDEILYGGK